MSQEETLYEKTVRNLKNRKSVVIVLFLFALAIGAGQFLGGISNIAKFFTTKRTKLQATISLQQYDLLAEATESPKILDTLNGDVKDVRRISELIAEQLTAVIQPERVLDAEVEISGNTLNSSQSLIAYIHLWGPQQRGPEVKTFGKENGLDLLALSEDYLFFDPRRNLLTISIRDRKGYFRREFLEIFKKGDSFTFDEAGGIVKKKLRFRPRKSKVLVEILEVSGADREVNESVQASLNSEVRKALGGYDFIHLSPLNRNDLMRKREEIMQLPLGPGKGRLIDQYNVDFIVTGEIAIR